MKLLAVIEDKNKRLRAYLPAFMSPFRACMTRYCSVHDVPNFANTDGYVCAYAVETGSTDDCRYVDILKDNVNIILLLETDIIYEPPALTEGMNNPNVALNDDGCLIITVSIDVLFGLFGRKKISTNTTWDSFIGSYTENQLLQAVVQIPYPAVASNVSGTGTRGLATCVVSNGNEELAFPNTNSLLTDVSESPEVHWKYPSGDTYFDFGLEYSRPQAYTLDTLPGIDAHFGSLDLPGILDSEAYRNSLTDIVVKKNVSCDVNFANCIPIVNGLMYIPTIRNHQMYIRSAADLFWQGAYQLNSVTLMDFSELTDENGLTKLMFTGCELIEAKFDGKDYSITVKIPDRYEDLIRNGTMFTVVDGRLVTFDRLRMLGRNTVIIRFTDTELRYMRERDMQLTGNIAFNEFMIKPRCPHLDWLEALFLVNDTSDSDDPLLAASIQDSVNPNRSFFFFLPYKDIYINEYTVDDRLNYNGLLIHGNIAGMLQSCQGLEILEQVVLNYMDMRVLKHVTGTKPDLLYGSDAHIISYAPYKHLTVLDKHIPDLTRQSNISLESMPFVDRTAPEAVINSANQFRLLDIVKLR